MKKIVFLVWLTAFFAQIAWAQEKIEAPVWNVGDQWVFTQGTDMKVIRVDENGYSVKIANQTIVLDKSTLNRTFILVGKKREVYKERQRRLFDFPLVIGKSWKDKYSAPLRPEDVWLDVGPMAVSSLGDETIVYEYYRVLGREEVEVEAGRFKAIKIEY